MHILRCFRPNYPLKITLISTFIELSIVASGQAVTRKTIMRPYFSWTTDLKKTLYVWSVASLACYWGHKLFLSLFFSLFSERWDFIFGVCYFAGVTRKTKDANLHHFSPFLAIFHESSLFLFIIIVTLQLICVYCCHISWSKQVWFDK